MNEKIKQLILKKSTETLYLSNEIRNLLNVSIDFCEYNLDSDKICILHTLLKTIDKKSKRLINTIDKNTIEYINSL